MDAVLHREVRDAGGGGLRKGLAEPPLALHVAVKGLPGGVEVAREGVVADELVEPLLVDTRQKVDGVAVDLFPEIRIEPDE